MTELKTIALDAMGGDHGVSVVIPAALEILTEYAHIALILVGDESIIRAEIGNSTHLDSERLIIRHATQVIEMDEAPAQALRTKKDSSMRVAINLVKEGVAQACVSAGNTGALMATARYVLKTLPGIDRPAIIQSIPSVKGFTRMLDLGANIDCSADVLVQFAVMGSVLAQSVDGIKNPRVGLLNIGSEDIKGNDQVKQASLLLQKTNLNYIGYVEGNQIYSGDVDVVVCDGFVGNISLKTSEGVARMIAHFIREEFYRNPLTKLAGFVALPVLRAFRRRIDPRRYNGASLLGLRGIVLKSHGGADAYSFKHAIRSAILEVEKSVPTLIDSQLDSILSER